jgi:hypothetical protein
VQRYAATGDQALQSCRAADSKLLKTRLSRNAAQSYDRGMASKRPIPVTILACWLMLFGVLSPLFLVVMYDATLSEVIVNSPDMGVWHPIAQHLGANGVALFGMAYSLTLGFIGYGLWTLKEWARRVTLGLAVLWLLWTFWHAYSQRMFFDIGTLVALVLGAVLIFYLGRVSVRSTFGKDQLA